jgi:general secretion pathway protein L
MARRILAVDLGSHTLKAALIESTLRSCRVLGLFQQRRVPDRPLVEQVQELCATHNLHADTVLSCLPGDVVSHRFLSLPFTRLRQLQQTVPFELESQIPLGLDEVMIDFQVVRRTADGATILAVAVPRNILTEHLETLAGAGLDPAAVGLAPLAPLSLLHLAGVDMSGVTALLDMGETSTSVVLLRDGILGGLRTLNVGLNRTGGLAAFLQELRWTLLVLGGDERGLPARFFLCGGGARIGQLRAELGRALEAEILPLQHWAVPPVPEEYRQEQAVFAACLGLGLREALGLTVPAVNLRRGAFAHQGQREALRRELARLGWLATGVAAAAGLAFALEMHRLNARYEVLRQEIRRVFTTTLPEVQTIVSEKAQLQEAVVALRSRQRFMRGEVTVSPLDLLRQLSTALPKQVSLDLDEWTFDAEAVRLRGTTSSFDAAETIKTAVTGLGLFREVQLKDVKTTAGGKKVSFGLQMLLNQERQE